jgi:hypothetical protein
MHTQLKLLTRFCALVAFLCCLLSGLWILHNVGLQSRADAVWTALGLYLVGKAFFVGPMLLVAAESLGRAPR